MSDDDLDRILSTQEDLAPSAGFVASVMEAVRYEQATPPPIPFPWKRAIPGLGAAGVALAWIVLALVAEVARHTMGSVQPATISPELTADFESALSLGAGWIALALLLTLSSLGLSLRTLEERD